MMTHYCIIFSGIAGNATFHYTCVGLSGVSGCSTARRSELSPVSGCHRITTFEDSSTTRSYLYIHVYIYICIYVSI